MSEIKRPNIKPIFFVVIAIYIAVLALNWNRLHYGVEISDEAYYVAEAYMVSKGAIPFTNNWTQVPGATLLYWPLVKLFTAITGGTEGIYLLMRQAFFIYKLLVAGVLAILFKRKYPLSLSLLLPLPYLSYAIFSIDSFSYNSISFSFLLVSCVMLYSAIQESEKYGTQLSFLAGILMALAILAHLSQLFTALYVFVLVVIFERRRFKNLYRSFSFVLGGILTAIAVIAYQSTISGGIKPIISGIAIMLQQPYFHLEGVDLNHNLRVLRGTITLLGNFFIPGGVIFAGLVVISYIFRKKIKTDAKTICIFTLLFAQILNVFIYVCRYSNYRNIPLDTSVCQSYVLLLLLFSSGWRKHLTIVLLIFSPFLCFYLLNVILNYNGISSRGYILFPSIMLSILLTYFALENATISKLTGNQKSIGAHAGIILLTIAFCTACTVGYYGYVYRDGSVSTLTYKMERGVYKGLYTLEERGKALIHLEDEIRKVTDERDAVLFMDQAPQAYLMTQATHCAPSTWDMQLYLYGYNNAFEEDFDWKSDFLLQAYFTVVGREPDKIIYVQDKERLEHLSLWDDDYRFTQYVKQNFTQTYNNDAEQFAIIVFERNQ